MPRRQGQQGRGQGAQARGDGLLVAIEPVLAQLAVAREKAMPSRQQQVWQGRARQQPDERWREGFKDLG